VSLCIEPQCIGGQGYSLLALSLLVAGCRSHPTTTTTTPTPIDAASPIARVADASVEPVVVDAAPTEREIGPYQRPFLPKRNVYFVVSKSTKTPARLVANLHGVCNPPGYACGYWTESASKVGFLVCPEGNSTCGAGGPPTWTEPHAQMDADLEKAIAVVDQEYPGQISREGAILTGFSYGAYAAATIARAHPGRWPYLILTEANVPLDASSLRTAGVKAVALVAGEIGSQIAGERATALKLQKQGFSARLWVMKGAGHHYSPDVDAIMGEALAWVLAQE
jgi:nitrous oxide reductase accessory protein NosL